MGFLVVPAHLPRFLEVNQPLGHLFLPQALQERFLYEIGLEVVVLIILFLDLRQDLFQPGACAHAKFIPSRGGFETRPNGVKNKTPTENNSKTPANIGLIFIFIVSLYGRLAEEERGEKRPELRYEAVYQDL